MALLVVGCATQPEEPEPQRKPPEVRLGPVVELLKVSTGKDKIRVISGPDDQVHVLIASASLQQVLAITVRPEGVTGKQIIRSNISPLTIDGAFDARKQFHVLIDTEHLVLENGDWHTSSGTAWQRSQVQAERPQFVRGSRDLVWSFTAFGVDMGATEGRWVWRGSGGGYPAGGFIIYPWYEKTRKTVLVADSATSDNRWNVLDPHSKLDTSIIDAMSDSAGNVHLIYAVGQNIHLADTTSFLGELLGQRAGEIKYHYARVEAADIQTAMPGASGWRGQGKEVRELFEIVGSRQLDRESALSADPITGTVLLADRWLVRGNRWTETTKLSPFRYERPIQVAAAGNESFHVIAVGNIDARFAGREGIKYAMLANGEWSAPAWLGVAGTSSLLNRTTVSMAATSNGNAFAVWSTEQGFVGRWIERGR